MEQLNQLLENEAFMEKVTSAGSVEEIAAIFAENGVELSTEEIKGMIQEVISGKTAGGELDETALESVAGGKWSIPNPFKSINKWLNKKGEKMGKDLFNYWDNLINKSMKK